MGQPAAVVETPLHVQSNIQRIPLNDLVHDPKNPRVHDTRNMEGIRRSLGEHGQVEPLVVQAGSMMVVGGNGRLEAMGQLGWTHADCVVLELTDTQARRLSITLNRTGELAEWDASVLAQHLDELSSADADFDVEGLGFSDEEYMKLIADFGGVVVGGVNLDPSAPQGPLSTDGNQPLVPAGMQPAHLPSSHVRMVQLFFNEQTMPQFRTWCAKLAEEYGTDNLTDTVHECLRRVAHARGWPDGGEGPGEPDPKE